MTRRWALVLIILFSSETPRGAQQATTSDGVEALLHGNYVRAAEILKPIAERPLRHDHVAEFFMATLYETGRGVPTDLTRACALYVRSGSGTGSPFDKQWSGSDFDPVRFTLEPGHWITWDAQGATISYEGTQKRIETPTGAHDVIFLPVLHTELSVGPMRSTRRHFIEVFFWAPRSENEWMLGWNLYEVVRDNLVRITTDSLTTKVMQDPRTLPPIDVRQFVRLRVTDEGKAEMVMLHGSRAGSTVIESDEERQEAKQRELARRNADAGVDWKGVRDVRRTPALTYADGDGCANVSVYGWSADRTEAITISADRDALQLSTTPQTFDVAPPRAGLEIAVHVYERPRNHWPFCTDVIVHDGSGEEIWRVTRGTITIQLSAPGVDVRFPSKYRATIRIDGAEFMNDSGSRVEQSQPIILTAVVGWFAG